MNFDANQFSIDTKSQRSMQELFDHVSCALKFHLLRSSYKLDTATEEALKNGEARGSIIQCFNEKGSKSNNSNTSLPLPTIQVKISCPKKFAKIREKRSIVGHCFVSELAKPLRFIRKDNKGLMLAFSASHRYIVKTVTSSEAKHLKHIVPEFAKHLDNANPRLDILDEKNDQYGLHTAQTLCLCQVRYTAA